MVYKSNRISKALGIPIEMVETSSHIKNVMTFNDPFSEAEDSKNEMRSIL